MSIIMLLMGVSSSGKSSVAKCLKEKSKIPFNIVGFDYAVEEKLDKKYWPGGISEQEGFYYVDQENGPELRKGFIGKKFLKEMMDDIILRGKSGENLIVDQVLSDEEYEQIETEFSDSKIIRIGLKPPITILLERELKRGDRKIGIAEKAYNNFYKGKIFDIEIDSSSMAPEKISENILKMIF